MSINFRQILWTCWNKCITGYGFNMVSISFTTAYFFIWRLLCESLNALRFLVKTIQTLLNTGTSYVSPTWHKRREGVQVQMVKREGVQMEGVTDGQDNERVSPYNWNLNMFIDHCQLVNIFKLQFEDPVHCASMYIFQCSVHSTGTCMYEMQVTIGRPCSQILISAPPVTSLYHPILDTSSMHIFQDPIR